MDSKKPVYSKTLWASLFVSVAAFFPPVAKFIAEQPEMYSMILGGAFAALRIITKGKVNIL